MVKDKTSNSRKLSMEKGKPFQQMVLEQLCIHRQKKKKVNFDLNFITHIQIGNKF